MPLNGVDCCCMVQTMRPGLPTDHRSSNGRWLKGSVAVKRYGNISIAPSFSIQHSMLGVQCSMFIFKIAPIFKFMHIPEIQSSVSTPSAVPNIRISAGLRAKIPTVTTPGMLFSAASSLVGSKISKLCTSRMMLALSVTKPSR